MKSYLDLTSLWYITHIDNLESILRNGIFSHKECQKMGIKHIDVSDHGVQKRRKEFHNYVPLFFATNTPMLYVVLKKFKEIVLLEINILILSHYKIKFSDGNIASSDTTIFTDLQDLEKLDWGIILSPYPAYWGEWKRKRSAEVLVPKRIDPKYITGIHCPEDEPETYSKVLNIVNKMDIEPTIKQDLSINGIAS